MSEINTPVFTLDFRGRRARAQVKENRFTVLSGSQARMAGSEGSSEAFAAEQEGLLADGRLAPSVISGMVTFTQDVSFDDVLTATAVILGQNGPVDAAWIAFDDQGQRVSYHEWLSQNVKESPPNTSEPLEASELVAENADVSIVPAPNHGEPDAAYSYRWLPFFHKLVRMLLVRDPSESIQAFQQAAAAMGEPTMQRITAQLKGMDPVTGVSLAGWFVSPEKRLRWIHLLAGAFQIQAALPEREADLKGLLSAGYLESIVMYDETQEDRQWAYDLTASLLNGSFQSDHLASLLTRPHFKLGEITHLLGTLVPQRFAPLYSLNSALADRPKVKTPEEYLRELQGYQGKERWPVELLEREVGRSAASSDVPAAADEARDERWQKVTAWLMTQGDNLVRNERDYKLSGAQKVREQLQAFLDDPQATRVSVHPNNLLNLLAWRTVGGLNSLVARFPEAFRAALKALWQVPRDPMRATDFWEALDPYVRQLGESERRPLSGLGTRASIASYFLFLVDPTRHPFYRPSFGGAASEWLYGRQDPLNRESPGHLLSDYVRRGREILHAFQVAGVPLQDALDLQGALYIISQQYPGGPRGDVAVTGDALVREFQAFMADPVHQLRCAVRRVRADQIRKLLSGGDFTLSDFNHEVWRYNSGTLLDGEEVKGQLYSENLTAAQASAWQVALDEGRLELHGNHHWGSGASVYGSRLNLIDEEKSEVLRQAAQCLTSNLTPQLKAEQLLTLPGFGENVSSGLTMLFHPDGYALYNQRSREALSALHYDTSSPEQFQLSAQELLERVGAPNFLTLDWFLYSRAGRPGFWWVNQGRSYVEERDGGYVWASNEGERNLFHHDNVMKLRPGDRILHYANQAIQAISTVVAPPVEVQEGEVRSGAIPAKDGGFYAEVDYQELSSPIALQALPMTWRQKKFGPFDKNGNVLHGYLFEVNPEFFEVIRQMVREEKVWLFQANPKYFDLASHLQSAEVGDTDDWSVTRYASEMQAGDVILLWLAGKEGGIYAVGELTSAPGPREGTAEWRVNANLEEPAGELSVPYRLTHLLNPPIPRQAIEQHPVLSQMLVMRAPAATNFRVSAAEWQALQPMLVRDEQWRDALIAILSESEEAMHVSVVTQKLSQESTLPIGLHPEQTVSRVLAAFPEKFEALGSGMYRLKRKGTDIHIPVSFSDIRVAVLAAGLKIDERTLRRYHLALQTRGFVILSGVSGTGKTWLAEAYARAAGARVQVFPVAPNWTSNEDLLGFYSPLEGGHYHHTAFSRFLLEAGETYRAARESGRTPRPYHLVLDEMNLARVEYYFAQFLSKMELRRRDGEAEIDLGPGLKALFPPNVSIIGTVNIDETTHDFADKVYDRAQVIQVPVTREQLLGHLQGKEQAELLLAIWDLIHPVAPFAFRVMDDVQAYVEAAGELQIEPLEALDDAVLQKILPKLRGTDPRMLSALQDFMALVEGRLPLSQEKAKQMHLAGSQHGFVSFH